MPIRKTKLHLSKNDKQLIKLLSELILYGSDNKLSGNIPDNVVPISDSEAETLLVLLEKLLNSKEFQEQAYFIESIFSDGITEGDHLRNIFLEGRKRRGREKHFGNSHWHNFLVRLGTIKFHDYGVSAKRMEFSYFLEIERKLLEELKIDPRVSDILLKMMLAQSKSLDMVRRTSKNKIQTKKMIENLIEKIKPAQQITISRTKLVGTIGLAIDSSAMFTTRDWGTAAALSQVASYLVYISDD